MSRVTVTVLLMIIGLALLIFALFAMTGCAIGDAVRATQDATVRCREAGYIGVVKDAGAFYCWKDKLPQLPPQSAPKAAP